MDEVLRQEKKFLITLPQYYLYAHRLSRVLAMDRHSRGDGYVIRSLYFDTLDDKDFEDKEDGVALRRKIRLRHYGSDTPFAMLEMKQKQGLSQKKRSLKMNREDAYRLTIGDYTPLLTYEEPFAAECFGLMNALGYRPKTVITYQRKVFVAKENSTRITFDHHIVGTEACFDIFSNNLSENILLDPYWVVLEVKFNGFLLSYIKDALKACDASELAVSKYCLGRAISRHYLF